MGYKNLQALTLVFVSAVFFFSCKKEVEAPAPDLPSGEEKVFIVCEGSMGNGNAALSLYLPEKDSVYEDIYKTVNGKALGDVFQSMVRVGGQYLLSVNNSDKILSVDSGLKLKAMVSVSKPRYLLPVNHQKVFVSSLFSNQVFILNPVTMVIEKTLSLPAQNPEGMLLFNQQLYICPWDTGSNKVYVVNPQTAELTDSFSIPGVAPSEILLDKEHKLWILSGNASEGKPAFWTCIDPATHQILKTFAFPPDAEPIHPVMNPTRDTLYFVEVNYNFGAAHNGVFRMSIYDQQLPETAFIPAQPFQYFWGLGIHPENGDIYVGDPKGFIQKSTVFIYRPDGSLKKQFNTGVGAGHFYFSR